MLHVEKLSSSSAAVLTVEADYVPADALEAAASVTGCRLVPAPAVYRVLQDRLLQKQHLRAHSLPVLDFMQIDGASDCTAAFEHLDCSGVRGVLVQSRIPDAIPAKLVSSVLQLQNEFLVSCQTSSVYNSRKPDFLYCA